MDISTIEDQNDYIGLTDNDELDASTRSQGEMEEREDAAEAAAREELEQRVKQYRNPFSAMLIESKNIVFHGAPGTGKTHLAREIAIDVVSDGQCDKWDELSDEQKRRVEFVQFHPSYDYSDFVEGLRPKMNDDGTMGFELRDGIFKRFIARARKNFEDSQKPEEIIEKEAAVQAAIDDFRSIIELNKTTFTTKSGDSIFTITSFNNKHIRIKIEYKLKKDKVEKDKVKKIKVKHDEFLLNVDDIRRMLLSDKEFSKVKKVAAFLERPRIHEDSYYFVLHKEIKKREKPSSKVKIEPIKLKNYVFIIDEINRGEISKIFGELFFAIDPGYRGRKGEVSTQYANLNPNPDEKFYIPENAYIIGTMNDIDRSVEPFDFAMRRRFRFVELKANEQLDMLDSLKDDVRDEAIRRMEALNKKIANNEDLNENYQIGPAYFLKLETLDFDQLWTDYLRPLLREYVRGARDEKRAMKQFAKAYGYEEPTKGSADEGTED
ncbi:MAG: AAA family ATPase [Thermoguttaceae bacterium]|nr:AAA family ATPase [Thermoguttaceae bacterium]